MKVFMDLEEHMAMKEKRNKKIKSKNKESHGYEDDFEFMMNKKRKHVKSKTGKIKNNKKVQYDYQDDLESLDYDIYKFK